MVAPRTGRAVRELVAWVDGTSEVAAAEGTAPPHPAHRKARTGRPRAFRDAYDLVAAWYALQEAHLPGTQPNVAELLRCGDRTIRDFCTHEGLQWPPPW